MFPYILFIILTFVELSGFKGVVDSSTPPQVHEENSVEKVTVYNSSGQQEVTVSREALDHAKPFVLVGEPPADPDPVTPTPKHPCDPNLEEMPCITDKPIFTPKPTPTHTEKPKPTEAPTLTPTPTAPEPTLVPTIILEPTIIPCAKPSHKPGCPEPVDPIIPIPIPIEPPLEAL